MISADGADDYGSGRVHAARVVADQMARHIIPLKRRVILRMAWKIIWRTIPAGDVCLAGIEGPIRFHLVHQMRRVTLGLRWRYGSGDECVDALRRAPPSGVGHRVFTPACHRNHI